MTVPEYVTFIRNRFVADVDSVLAKYPANSTDEVQLLLVQIMTDYDFSTAAKFVAESMSDLEPNTYLYRYSYALPVQPLGAFHGRELFLLFNVPVPNPPNSTVSDNLVALWTRFPKQVTRMVG
jgi:para-nitrobenzyl esterase